MAENLAIPRRKYLTNDCEVTSCWRGVTIESRRSQPGQWREMTESGSH